VFLKVGSKALFILAVPQCPPSYVLCAVLCAGMKTDMGGSAGILCAWKALVENSAQGWENPSPVHALLCLAENSVGPDATRPDDVHVFYSGEVVVCCWTVLTMSQFTNYLSMSLFGMYFCLVLLDMVFVISIRKNRGN
jgi:hypothetical protein